jgi:hypothetical protein
MIATEIYWTIAKFIELLPIFDEPLELLPPSLAILTIGINNCNAI